MSNARVSRVLPYIAVFAAGSLAATSYFALTNQSDQVTAEPRAQLLQAASGNDLNPGQSPAVVAEDPAPAASTEPTVAQPPTEAPTEEIFTPLASESFQVAPEAAVVEMTAVSDIVRGSMVLVGGSVERVTDEDEFVLVDATGSIPVWTGNSFFVVEPGESVRVRGYVDDDLLLEIYAQEIIREDGTVVRIRYNSDW